MGDLTKNISRHEVLCHCGKCGVDTIDFETVMLVQGACDHFAEKLGVDKVILRISSGSRCQKHNDTPVKLGGAGGSKGSYHKKMKAIDHHIDGVSVRDLYDYYNSLHPNRLGLGLYEKPKVNTPFVHIDPRPIKARW